MRIGYARVSTHEQNLDLQKDALKKAGCEKIVVDVASGKKTQRSGLDRVRELLRKRDVLVVWRLDRSDFPYTISARLMQIFRTRRHLVFQGFARLGGVFRPPRTRYEIAKASRNSDFLGKSWKCGPEKLHQSSSGRLHLQAAGQ